MDASTGPPSKPGILRLNPQAAPFQPVSSSAAAAPVPVALVPPSESKSNANKKKKNKNKTKSNAAPPARKKGQKDNFGPKGQDKPVPPVVVAVAAEAPPVQAPAKPVVIMISGRRFCLIPATFSIFFFLLLLLQRKRSRDRVRRIPRRPLQS